MEHVKLQVVKIKSSIFHLPMRDHNWTTKRAVIFTVPQPFTEQRTLQFGFRLMLLLANITANEGSEFSAVCLWFSTDIAVMNFLMLS